MLHASRCAMANSIYPLSGSCYASLPHRITFICRPRGRAALTPRWRDECCHSRLLLFDENGVLYISVGDNTNPFASDGYTPIDERAGRAAWDAQRTSSNTRDLRGKILRIIPQADGSYRTPDDNLFSQRPGDGLPEIFVMGVRNPFRMALDAQRGWLYWGDVGPDAGSASAQRGPEGLR